MSECERVLGLDTRGYNLKVNKSKQGRHIQGSPDYIEGRSILTADPEMLVRLHAGHGTPIIIDGVWSKKERFIHGDIVGIWKSPDGKVSVQTYNGIIHYSRKKGVHIVPAQP